MNQMLSGIAQQLKDNTQERSVSEQVAARLVTKKVQLIYAFNGSGKTRLSREFKELVNPKGENSEDSDEPTRSKILYYNAFTEDLFYWDNDLRGDVERKLCIQPNAYTRLVLVEQGQDQNAITHFQRYTDDKLTPRFNEEYTVKDKDGKERIVPAFSEVTFSFERGDDQKTDNVKISKGEESSFIWSIFYAVLEQVIEVLNVAEPDQRETDQFNELEYIFIDDPVSSLDDNHLIQLAVDLAALIKSNESNLKFIISTHNPLFYNVLCNELGSNDKSKRPYWKAQWLAKFRLDKSEDGSQTLIEQPNDSPFSYHLHLLSYLEEAIETGQVEKYHFNLLRNILEKTATFLGYKRWEQLLPESEDSGPNLYAKRIVNFASHSKHSADESKYLEPQEKNMLGLIVKHVINTHKFRREENQNA